VTALQEIEELIRARQSLIGIVSAEEARVEIGLREVARRVQKPVMTWSCTGGLTASGGQPRPGSGTTDPIKALDEVLQQVDPALFVFHDLHPWLNRQHPNVVRRLREVSRALKETRKTLILVSPALELPAELETETAVLPFPLPNEADLAELLGQVVAEFETHPSVSVELDAAARDRFAQAARGLTLAEAESALARLLVRHSRLGGDLLPELIHEKRRLIARSGLLEFCEATESFDTVGGLAGVKDWLRVRERAFTREAREFGLPAPRGMLLLGVQGCGKSLCAKAAAALWQAPLLRFDAGRLFSSLVGSSEENARRAIAVAESIAPAVLWVDEIDKAFAGMRGSGSVDAGTTARVFGTFLTWLAEKQAPVFVAATANDLTHLPPELLRKGRFDELFFVDLPAEAEREEIFAIHLRKRRRQPEAFDLGVLANAAEGCSGAEIEQAISNGLCEAFHEGRDLADTDILRALQETVPLARTMAESINRLRDWAHGRARIANAARVG
jgi:AAA+ superfamily predicted ATPase